MDGWKHGIARAALGIWRRSFCQYGGLACCDDTDVLRLEGGKECIDGHHGN